MQVTVFKEGPDRKTESWEMKTNRQRLQEALHAYPIRGQHGLFHAQDMKNGKDVEYTRP